MQRFNECHTQGFSRPVWDWQNHCQRYFEEKDDYIAQYEASLPKDRKRKDRKTDVSEVNELMFQWFRIARERGVPISGPLLQEKARKYAEELGIDNFTASNGWLATFKTRHKIKAFHISGESLDVDPVTIDSWKEQLPDVTAGFKEEDIFNCDETGLFFRALPDKTLATKGSKCFGGKCSKDRLSVLFCTSSTGEKLKPLVIGKAKKPRCFKNVNVSELPVKWEAQSKAWMTGVIFAKWLNQLDRTMCRQGRKILLFLDNARCHPQEDLQLTNITLKFFPPNCTSCLQPLDLGIIRCFKAHYRKQLLRYVLAKMEDDQSSVSEIAKCVTALNAVDWIARAWNEVKENTIQHCFSATGLNTSEDAECLIPDEEAELQPLLESGPFVECSVGDFITADDNLPSCENLGDNWETQILEEFTDAQSMQEIADDDEEDCEEDIPGSHLTHREVLSMLELIRGFAVCTDPDFLTPVNSLKSLAEKKITSTLTQSTLDIFFH